MSSNNNQWCTIESDPGVFTSLIESFGVKNAEFTELWSLDDDTLNSLGDEVYGLIFLFKWQAQKAEAINDGKRKPLTNPNEIPNDLYFAKQVITNACATQAIISVLLNSSNSSNLVLGNTLSSLKNFSMSFTPELRGEAISASDEIRTAHNSFARNDSFLSEPQYKVADESSDVFHFVAYIPHNSTVYELDGLQPGPIPCGDFSNEQNSWLHVARTSIQERIEKYAADEIKFNLMAVVQDKRVTLQTKLNTLTEAGVADEDVSVVQLRAELLAEEEKRRAWEVENVRRRHNYLPFLLELMKSLTRADQMNGVVEKAKDLSGGKKRGASGVKN